jgi:hypothetical protein
MAETLADLSGLIRGRSKIIIDVTNAKYKSPSESLCPVDIHQVFQTLNPTSSTRHPQPDTLKSSPLTPHPSPLEILNPQPSTLYSEQVVLNDASAKWAVAYKSVFAFKLDFGGETRHTIDICGHPEARIAAADLVRSHGWSPRIRGGLEEAKTLEPGRRVAYLKLMYGDS